MDTNTLFITFNDAGAELFSREQGRVENNSNLHKWITRFDDNQLTEPFYIGIDLESEESKMHDSSDP